MQNTFSQSGNDSKWFLKKSFFQNMNVELETPPTFMEKTILNFHFDYLTPSLTTTSVPEKRGKGQKLQDVQAKTI